MTGAWIVVTDFHSGGGVYVGGGEEVGSHGHPMESE